MLTPGFVSQQGAAGHGVLVFSVRNSSQHQCHTFGYPGIRFLASSGLPLPTSSVRTTHDIAGSAPLRALTLAPGQSASFRLAVTHGAVPGSSCTTAAMLAVIAPDDTAVMRIVIPNGAYECATATVTPLQSGNSAGG